MDGVDHCEDHDDDDDYNYADHDDSEVTARQCHRLPICFLTSDLTRNKNQRNLIERRASLSSHSRILVALFQKL